MIEIAQATIRISVDFFADEQEKLRRYPTYDRMEAIVRDGIEVPVPEFLTYYLFHRKRPGKPGYRTYAELRQRIHQSVAHLEDFVEFNGVSLSTAENVGAQDLAITERVGEALGLAVINRVHGLTEADWDKIPESRGRGANPTFDFRLQASDGQGIIQAENKGASRPEPRDVRGSISNHARNIRAKKSRIADIDDYPHPADLRYGTIGVLALGESVAHCWLLDPPPAPPGNSVRRRNLRYRRPYSLRAAMSMTSFGPRRCLRRGRGEMTTDAGCTRSGRRRAGFFRPRGDSGGAARRARAR